MKLVVMMNSEAKSLVTAAQSIRREIVVFLRPALIGYLSKMIDPCVARRDGIQF